MPTYNFINKDTGEVTEKLFSIKLREEYLRDNPQLESILLGAPSLVDPIRLGIRKPDDGFREVLAKAKEAHPLGNINTF